MVPTDPIGVTHTTNLSAVADIPALPGSYALVLVVPQSLSLDVGRLGLMTLVPGRYVYFGSAMGPGGLQARIRRHLRPDKARHWHIDYLTQRVQPAFIHWRCAPHDLETAGNAPPTQNVARLPHSKWVRLECVWCRRVAQCAGVGVPVHHFGSTDCRAGCPAHLLELPPEMTITQLLGELT